MLPVVLLRRQSPDWAAMSADFRAGRPVDPARYVPSHPIPAFPEHVDRLIGEWNRRFRVDFFTFRAELAAMSAASTQNVRGAIRVSFEEMDGVAELARRQEFYLFPHDDDDFFSPALAEVVGDAPGSDAVVTPLYFIGRQASTFCRPGCIPDHMLAAARPHQHRFHSNNYAIHSRRLQSVADVAAVKDHIDASRHAERHAFSETVLPRVISATVKTPASASMLTQTFQGWRRRRRVFKETQRTLRSLQLPPGFEWVSEPSARIAELLRAVY